MKVYIGIDWSQSKHDVAMMNEAGAVIVQQVIAHSEEGFHKLDHLRGRMGVVPERCVVGLETAHNLLIDFLWSRGYTHVYVVPPNMVKSCRGRYRQSGARSDASDAVLLADLVRTDHSRLQRWHPDGPLTCQIRAKVSLVCFLTRQSTILSNRLRASLLRYYPAALNVFSSLRTRIALQFICAYPTPQAAAALTFAEFETFARQHRYHRYKALPGCFVRLQSAHLPALPSTVLSYQDEAPLLAQQLLHTLQAKAATLQQLKELFTQHPDRMIFDSLPGAGNFLAPALLSKFGDDRQRFPTPGSVQALAGTCPVTYASGNYKSVRFRRACDHDFRYITQQWAVAATWHSPWARHYFQQAQTRCRSVNHAYRCLANRLLGIAWKLWQTHQPYNEAYHWQQCVLRSKPKGEH
jgi:transposase